MSKSLLVVAFALSIAAGRLPADQPPAGSGQLAHSLHGETFDDGPRQQAAILPGMGDVSFPVSTKSAEAQRFFDQGVAQLHTFYYFEAERSFRQAAYHDPELGMAYWGMAMANTNNDKRARGFLQKAKDRSKGMSDREKKFLDALSASYQEGKNGDERREGYIKGLEAVVHAYPDDIEAKAFLAWALVGNFWGSDRGAGRVAVDALIEDVLRRSPIHPGAHHYRIHLWDNSKPEVALRSALAYARAAPGIAHAWHMPGHIYNGVHRFSDAAYQQEASARVDHAHMLAHAILPLEIHNYAHNEHYLVAQLSHLGRVHDAVALSRNLIQTPRDSAHPQGAQRLGRLSLLRIDVRYERWVDLLGDPAFDWTDEPEERGWKAYGRGLARLGLGQIEKAREEAEDLAKAVTPADKKEEAKKDPYQGVGSPLLVASMELDGRILLADGKLIEGFDLLHRAAKTQAERFRHDLSGYPRPLYEAVGLAHLDAQDYGLAEASFRAALNLHQNMVPALAGLAEACHRGGKEKDAAEAYRLYLAARREADADLVFEKRLAPFAAALASAAAALPPAPVEVARVNGHAPGDIGANGANGSSGANGAKGAAAHEGRVPLGPLGPLLWAPSPAPDFTVEDPNGEKVSLSRYRGKNVLLIFYLGAACPHCLEQVQTFAKEKEALAKLDTEVVVVSDDPPQKNRELLASPEGAKLGLTLFSDPDRKAARLYRAHDTFENLPLHATVLIDREQKIRWLKAGPDPFKDTAFLKAEVERVNRFLTPIPRRQLDL